MTNLKLDFYSEVIIKDSCPNDLLENGETIKGKKGVILGISEEDGIIYGYTILLFDIKYCIYIDKKYIIPTGKKFSRDDFY
ncbi:immunity protein 31 [Neisseria gonorrhoeae]